MTPLSAFVQSLFISYKTNCRHSLVRSLVRARVIKKGFFGNINEYTRFIGFYRLLILGFLVDIITKTYVVLTLKMENEWKTNSKSAYSSSSFSLVISGLGYWFYHPFNNFTPRLAASSKQVTTSRTYSNCFRHISLWNCHSHRVAVDSHADPFSKRVTNTSPNRGHTYGSTVVPSICLKNRGGFRSKDEQC